MAHTKKKAKIIVAVVVLCFIGTASAIIFTSSENESFLDMIQQKKGEPRYDYTGGSELFPVEFREKVWNNITGDFRPNYPNMTNEEYAWIFGNLPPFPEDFFSITELVYEGKIADFSRITEEYWKQPEFYTAWFSLYEPKYLRNNPGSWCPEGYGCFPLIKEGYVDKGVTMRIDTFFRTGFAVEAYQGLILRPYMPKEAKNVMGNTLFEQSDSVEKYFNYHITNPDNAIFTSFKDSISSNNVLEKDWFTVLEPTYSLILDKYGNFVQYQGFPEDWVQIVTLEIDVAPDTPTGDYVFAFKIEEPCYHINQEFYYSIDHEYYGSKYNPVGRMFKTDIPHFQLILHVQ